MRIVAHWDQANVFPTGFQFHPQCAAWQLQANRWFTQRPTPRVLRHVYERREQLTLLARFMLFQQAGSQTARGPNAAWHGKCSNHVLTCMPRHM